jgi:hypothetical protein
VEFPLWEAEYRLILEELSLTRESDEKSAMLLSSLIKDRPWREERLVELLKGRDVVVVGGGPGPSPFPLPKGEWAVVAADGATSTCLAAGVVPAVITTDLDGYMPDEIQANEKGSFVLVHAHGDNMEALKRWVPKFPGEIGGSVASAPLPGLVNYGGFTDGDRAVYLAEACGAKSVLLARFDFKRVSEKDGRRKLQKLRVAERVIDHVVQRGKMPVYVLTSSGIKEWSQAKERTTRLPGPRSRRAK